MLEKIVKTNNHISTVFDEIFVTQVTAFVACEHKLWTSGCYDEMFISTTIRDPQTFHRAGKSKFYCLNELPNKENPDHQQMCFRNLENYVFKPLLYIHQYPVDLTLGQYPTFDNFSLFLQQLHDTMMHVI